MTAIITALGDWVTAVIGMVGDWLALITTTGNEVLLLKVVIIPLVGIGIGALARMFRFRV